MECTVSFKNNKIHRIFDNKCKIDIDNYIVNFRQRESCKEKLKNKCENYEEIEHNIFRYAVFKSNDYTKDSDTDCFLFPNKACTAIELYNRITSYVLEVPICTIDSLFENIEIHFDFREIYDEETYEELSIFLETCQVKHDLPPIEHGEYIICCDFFELLNLCFNESKQYICVKHCDTIRYILSKVNEFTLKINRCFSKNTTMLTVDDKSNIVEYLEQYFINLTNEDIQRHLFSDEKVSMEIDNEKEDVCCICLEAKPELTCWPCQHTCVCTHCSIHHLFSAIKASNFSSCPICRTPIIEYS